MSTMGEYQTDSITGINYANMISSGKGPKLDNEEIKELYVRTHDNRLKKFKTKEDVIKKSKKIRLDKKTIAILMGIGIGLGAVATTQVIGANQIATEMSDDLQKVGIGTDKIYVTETGNRRLTHVGSHEFVDNEQEFLKEKINALSEEGINPNKAAVAIAETYGIGADRIPGSTFLGRMAEKEKAFTESLVKNIGKGASR